jgi:hypothetical protein
MLQERHSDADGWRAGGTGFTVSATRRIPADLVNQPGLRGAIAVHFREPNIDQGLNVIGFASDAGLTLLNP